jgi:cardiolipin synthase
VAHVYRPRRAAQSLAVALVAMIGALLSSGCAAIPRFEGVDEAAAASHAPPRLANARGPLTVKQSKDILDKLRRETPDADVLGRHLAFTQAISDSPLTAGNKVEILHDGATNFRAIFRAIAAAKNHVNLEYYIFEDVEQDGRRLADLLIEKQASGVQINLIYDSLGSSGTPGALFDRLKQAGVKVLQFNPIDPFKAKVAYSLNDRDHRKILIADGNVAIIGGVNISQVYGSSAFGSAPTLRSLKPEAFKADAPTAEGKPRDIWRDTNMHITGPAASELQRLFVETWTRQEGGALDQSGFFPEKQALGSEVVGVMGSTPTDDMPLYYITLLSALRNAESRIWLTNAYFVPTAQELDDLVAAARRGVDVRLMLPSRSDSQFALNVGRSRYARLLRNGVRIFEIRDVILHSKTAVVDGVWSVVGSSNFDGRSVLFNDEVDVVALGRETGAQMEAAFVEDIANADEITRQAWSRRKLPERLRQTFSRVWAYWL